MKIRNFLSVIISGLALMGLLASCNNDINLDDKNSAPASAEEVNLAGYNTGVDMKGAIGLTWKTGALDYASATLLPSSKILESGNTVIGMRFYISGASSVEVFIGNDYKNPQYTQTHEVKIDGWQYVILDSPITVSEDLYFGFKVTSPNLYVEKQQTGAKSNLFWSAEDGWVKLSDVYPNVQWPIQAVVTGNLNHDGDESDVVLVDADVKSYAMAGESMPVKCMVMNGGWKTVRNITVKCTFGGESVSHFLKSIALMKGEVYQVEIPDVKVPSDDNAQLEISVSSSEVKNENMDNNSANFNVRLYNERIERNRIYIEQFTGQACPNCPSGAAVMSEALQGMNNPEKACWVAHHAGYKDDVFTLPGSKIIVSRLGVNFAPACNINRMVLNAAGENALIWHPGYAYSALLNELAEEPALATLNVERQYNADTRELTVKASGRSIKDNAYVTAIVIQSGIEAAQSGVTGNYTHNYVPRKFLSAAVGDLMTLDADGNYSVEYKYTIDEKVGDFECKPEDMDVIVFVHGDINKSSGRVVFNADMVSVF